MRLANMILAIAASFWPLMAQAVEVDFGAETEAVYDTNVFRTSENAKDDASFRFSPSVEIKEKTDRLEADLYYKPTYEVFTTYSDANALSHHLESGLSYRINDRTQAELQNRFRVLYVLNSDDPDTIDEGSNLSPANDISRDEMFLFDSTLSVTHALSPRWRSFSEAAFNLFDPRERRQSIASNSVSAFQNFEYTHDQFNIFGVGGAGVVQMFDEIASIPASNTYIFKIFASYTRHFGESTTLTLRGGPAFIITRQDDADNATSSTYPFTAVDKDTTVGQLRDEGLLITNDFGFQSLDDDTPVPAGSVVVTNPVRCIDENPTNTNPNGYFGTALFDGNRCFDHELLLRNDPSIPMEFDAIAPIRNDMSDIMIFGSDSGSDDSTFTFFGDVSLTHRWTPQLFSTVSYNRSESTANGQGTSTIADTVDFLTVWRPDLRWDLSLRAAYVKRESPTDLSKTFAAVSRDLVPGSPTFELAMLTGDSVVVENSRSVDTHRWSVRVRVARRMTRHITVSGWARYSDQRSSNTVRNPNDFGDFTAIVGFQYDFDPFRF